ncbi:MAG: DUF1850 domain-containing protein [Syntrophomonadaceae bacterium]
MKAQFNYWKAAIICIILLFLGAGLFFPLDTLVIRQQNSENRLLIPMVGQKSFSLYYLHSVQKTPVQEHFVLAPGNQLLLTSTHYQSYGVGLPFLPEEGTLSNDKGVFLLTGINRSYREINIGFMPLAEQSLLYQDKRYEYKQYFEPGSLLQITVQKYSPFALIWLMREGGTR